MYAHQGWVGSRAGGFEAEAEAMMVIGSRDRSRSLWLPDLKTGKPKLWALGFEAKAKALEELYA